MKLYELGECVLAEYRKTKNNETVSYKTARKKLTRNILLATKFPDQEQQDTDLYMYGNLHITVKDNVITNLENHKGDSHTWFEQDLNQYRIASELFGLIPFKVPRKDRASVAV